MLFPLIIRCSFILEFCVSLFSTQRHFSLSASRPRGAHPKTPMNPSRLGAIDHELRHPLMMNFVIVSTLFTPCELILKILVPNVHRISPCLIVQSFTFCQPTRRRRGKKNLREGKEVCLNTETGFEYRDWDSEQQLALALCAALNSTSADSSGAATAEQGG